MRNVIHPEKETQGCRLCQACPTTWKCALEPGVRSGGECTEQRSLTCDDAARRPFEASRLFPRISRFRLNRGGQSLSVK